MSHMVLSAKSSTQWTSNVLDDLNISVELVDAPSFFGSPLPDPRSDPTLLAHPVLINNVTHPSGSISKNDSLFFRYLEHATKRFPAGPTRDSAVEDFIAFLLRMLDYDEPRRVVHQRMELDLLMCGQLVTVKPDVVVMDDRFRYYILLVQSVAPRGEAEPQLIAAAMAAHYENNRRRRAVGLPTVADKTFCGIVMMDTAPTLYQIPVSEALLQAVARGHYPSATTVVRKLKPPVQDLPHYFYDGIEPLDNRQIMLQCLGAFRQLVV